MINETQISSIPDGVTTPGGEEMQVTPYTPPVVIDASSAEKRVSKALAKLSSLTGKEYSL